ncbi:MAG: OmpA family protein [Marinibacterium sp.]|nr:OmpA family protein [Marinibacterium sp.]
MRIWALAVLAGLMGGPAAAQVLPLPPSARPVSERVLERGRYDLPVGVWDGTRVPVDVIDGRLEQRSWRIESSALTTLQASAPLIDALKADGFDIVLDCVDRNCGGFDFRYALSVIPAPDMYVDLRDFQTVSARRGEEIVNLLVSRGPAAVWVQQTQVFPGATLTEEAAAPVPSAPAAAPRSGDLAGELDAMGYGVLEDLNFASGSTDLGDGPYASLDLLADRMAKLPALRIALVGHTDLSGSLDVNIRVSRARAQSVKARLVADYGIAPDRIEAEGVGYLSPLNSLRSAAGQAANRRVEVVLLTSP